MTLSLQRSLEQARRELLTSLSHEVRTPLTSIMGFADLLASDGDLPHAGLSREQAVARIKHNGDRLLSFLDKLVELSQLATSDVTAKTDELCPRALVEEIRAWAAPRAAARGLGFRVECADGLPEKIESDGDSLRRILLRLIENALRFSESGEIVLALRPHASGRLASVVFEVADAGPGLGPAQLEELFQPLVLPEVPDRSFGGSGLGLAVSEELARQLGGSIDVESELEVGSRFRVTIPVRRIS